MGQRASKEDGQDESDSSEHEVSPPEVTWFSTLNVYDNHAQIDRIIVFFNLYQQNRYNIPFEILYEIFFQYADVHLHRQAMDKSLMSVANGLLTYLSLPLRASPLYEIRSIDFEIESKDQGWSSFPAQHGTRENSNTWFVVAIPSLLPSAIQNSNNNQHLQHQPWSGCTIHRNIHAGRQWEIFRTSFSKKHNTELLSKVTEEWQRSIEENSSSNDQVAIVLQAHAAFPGWVNHIQRAEIRLNVTPTETFLSQIYHTIFDTKNSQLDRQKSYIK